MDLKHFELVTEIARVAHATLRSYDAAVGERKPAPPWKELTAHERQVAQLRVVTCLKAGDQEAPCEELERSNEERIRDSVFQGVVNAIYNR